MKNIQLMLWLILQLTYSVSAQNISDSTKIASKKERLTAKSDAKTRILKVSPIPFLTSYTAIAYEKSLKQGRSLELKLALIGAGSTPNDEVSKPRGLATTIGYKFIKPNNEPPKRNRYQHILRGWYFRPDFAVSAYKKSYIHDIYESNNINPTIKTERILIAYACLVPTVGFQRVRRNGLVTDFFIGAGAGVATNGEGVFLTTEYSNYMPLRYEATRKLGFSYAYKTGFLIGGLF